MLISDYEKKVGALKACKFFFVFFKYSAFFVEPVTKIKDQSEFFISLVFYRTNAMINKN